MKAYTTDEISYEITDFDIPRRLCATPPETVDGWYYYTPEGTRFVHYIGAIEGYMAGYNVGRWVGFREGLTTDNSELDLDNEGQTGATFDDDEYPAHRKITRLADGTLTLEARFGRNKKWVLAINRENDDLAKAWIEAWIRKETE